MYQWHTRELVRRRLNQRSTSQVQISVSWLLVLVTRMRPEAGRMRGPCTHQARDREGTEIMGLFLNFTHIHALCLVPCLCLTQATTPGVYHHYGYPRVDTRVPTGSRIPRRPPHSPRVRSGARGQPLGGRATPANHGSRTDGTAVPPHGSGGRVTCGNRRTRRTGTGHRPNPPRQIK